jgi:hypothetical protein
LELQADKKGEQLMTILADFYDLNVWSSKANELNITAYEWEKVQGENQLQTNTSKSHTITFSYREYAEIEFLLKDLLVNNYPLTDYDTWVDLKEIYNDKTPQNIKNWLENLPSYEIPRIILFEDEN